MQLRLASSLHHDDELVVESPAFGILLASWHHLFPQAPGLPQFVEGDHKDTQFLGDLNHARRVGRDHAPADISIVGLAIRAHRSIPSSPIVLIVAGMERRHLSWQIWVYNHSRFEPKLVEESVFIV